MERISDYRRYRQYDILKHPQSKQPICLCQYGTGFGWQLETPAYIIRAAVTSAFLFNEGDSHLRIVIVDETFMHMAESHSKSIINRLTNTLGLQRIFIIPTRKVPSPVAVGELNTRVLVDRQ